MSEETVIADRTPNWELVTTPSEDGRLYVWGDKQP